MKLNLTQQGETPQSPRKSLPMQISSATKVCFSGKGVKLQEVFVLTLGYGLFRGKKKHKKKLVSRSIQVS